MQNLFLGPLSLCHPFFEKEKFVMMMMMIPSSSISKCQPHWRKAKQQRKSLFYPCFEKTLQNPAWCTRCLKITKNVALEIGRLTILVAASCITYLWRRHNDNLDFFKVLSNRIEWDILTGFQRLQRGISSSTPLEFPLSFSNSISSSATQIPASRAGLKLWQLVATETCRLQNFERIFRAAAVHTFVVRFPTFTKCN